MGKILITGATGFIGGNLISHLFEKNYKMKIIYRKKEKGNYLKNFGETIFFDLQKGGKFDSDLKDVESIIHCAGSVRGNVYRDFYNGNLKITENLIKLVKESGAILKNFIYISSLSAFGPYSGNGLPTEENKPNPVSYYGICKLKTEEFLKKELNFPLIILRPSAVYGPGDKELLKFFKDSKNGNLILPFKKEQKFQLIFVKDLCNAIEKALDFKCSETFFISHPEILTIKEITLTLKEILRKNIKVMTFPPALIFFLSFSNAIFGIIFGKKTMFNPQKAKELVGKNWVCSVEKAKKLLNFEPIYNFNEGAKITYDWYIKNNWIKG